MSTKIFRISIIQIIFCLITVGGCATSADEADENTTAPTEQETGQPTTSLIRGICLFAGQVETFTADDWQAIADSPVTDFIIIPKEASEYGSSENGYKINLAPFMISVISQLVARKSNAKIWIGTPGITSLNFSIASSSLDPIYKYLSYIREKIGTTVWSKNIGGVYMNQEAVYGTMNYNDIYSNACVKLMSDLSLQVHSLLNTKFLWIPYYGFGTNAADLIKKIGYVANRTDIFDYVVIQPHYYFDESVPENLFGVQFSIRKQSVVYCDGIEVITKTSKTIIGPEMELSWRVVPPNNYTEYVNRYNEYVSSFIEFRNEKPIIFYWDGTLQNALIHRINPFFK